MFLTAKQQKLEWAMDEEKFSCKLFGLVAALEIIFLFVALLHGSWGVAILSIVLGAPFCYFFWTSCKRYQVCKQRFAESLEDHDEESAIPL